MHGTVGHRALDQDPVCQARIIYTHTAPSSAPLGAELTSKNQHLPGSLQSSVFTYAGLKAQHSHGLVSQRHISVCYRTPQLSQIVFFLSQGVSLL